VAKTSDAVTVAVTGASGIQYGLRLLECLLASDREVHLMVSDAARVVGKLEMDLALPTRPRDMERFVRDRFPGLRGTLLAFGNNEWTAPAASGSGAPRSMVVCPCTTGTLSAIAMGTSNSLIERAADVVLKERGTLILVPRETPFSEIHLDNMLKLARMGALMLPANPGFYHRPRTVADMVDFVVARVLDHLSVPQSLIPPWGMEGAPP